MPIGVCLKWVGADSRFGALSAADQAALEMGLRTAEAWDDDVTAVAAGEAGADNGLREALAAGAARAVRVDLAGSDAAGAAAAIAPVVAGCSIVWCGDYSLDRGTGSFPAFLAGELGWAQALGVVEVAIGAPGNVQMLRRLDGGRRERLAVRGGAVVSLEGSVAALRRAALRAVLAARSTPIEVVGTTINRRAAPAGAASPYRPRARVLAAPAAPGALQRVLTLLTPVTSSVTAEVVALEPPAAAAHILAALTQWGYLDPGAGPPAW